MCGIAGILNAHRAPNLNVAVLRRAIGEIAHRGPDSMGVWSNSHVGLAHCRLSIIDLAGGGQPIGNEDGTVQVVFNGEIYNYQILRDQLIAKGHCFRTKTDTEVLVHLYEEFGAGLSCQLRGMFAFAIWDTRKNQLLLARDRLGLKPLYIYVDQDKLIFGSEIKAILAHRDVKREIDPLALEAYLALGFVPGELSIFRNISKLPPGHFLVSSPHRLTAVPQRYWQYEPTLDQSKSVEAWMEEIDAKIEETVRVHQIADVSVGAFLSGGVDSAAMVCVQSKVRSDKVKSFSIGFQKPFHSELPFARQVARRFHTEHFEEVVTADAARSLHDVTYYFDEPFADTSAIPCFNLARLARAHVKVVVSGDGGDEAFGGYSRYAHDLRETTIRRHLPVWFRRIVLSALANRWPKADWLPRPLRAKTALMNLALDGDAAYANTISACRLPLRRQLLAGDVRQVLNGHDPEERIRKAFRTGPNGDALASMIAADVNLLLPDDFLTKVDRTSMSCGLEVRPPLVDHELMELAGRIPSSFKVRRGDTKWIFKRLFRERLPLDTTQHRKLGFEVPIDEWLRGPLREQFESSVLDNDSCIGAWIDTSMARRLQQRHEARIGNHGQLLWSLLVLSEWANRWMRSESHGSRLSAGLVADSGT